jgi:hypothetical protein
VEWTAPETALEVVITAWVDDGELDSRSLVKNIMVEEVEEPPPKPNSPPGIDLIEVTPETPYTDSKATIDVTAGDPDGDELRYDYQVSDGVVSGTGSQVTWLTPDREGSYRLKVTAQDPAGLSDSEKLYVRVLEKQYPPAIRSAGFDRDSATADGVTEVTLTARVVDPNGPEDIKSVTADLSALGLGDGEEMRDDGRKADANRDDGTYTLVFTMPEGLSGGTYTIPITALDLFGGSNSSVVRLVVEAHERPGSSEDGGRTIPGFSAGLAVAALAVLFMVAIPASRRHLPP